MTTGRTQGRIHAQELMDKEVLSELNSALSEAKTKRAFCSHGAMDSDRTYQLRTSTRLQQPMDAPSRTPDSECEHNMELLFLWSAFDSNKKGSDDRIPRREHPTPLNNPRMASQALQFKAKIH